MDMVHMVSAYLHMRMPAMHLTHTKILSIKNGSKLLYRISPHWNWLYSEHLYSWNSSALTDRTVFLNCPV